MIQRLSCRVVAFFLKNNAIKDCDKDIYQYGVEITISSILNIVVILTMGLLLQELVLALTYLLCFIVLRSFCGGYHAKTYLKCNVVFGIVFGLTLLAYWALSQFDTLVIAIAFDFISLVILAIFAPVVNENKPLTEDDKERAKNMSILLGCTLGVGSLVLVAFEWQIGFYCSIVLFAISMLILIEIGKGVFNYEKR